MDRVLRFLGLAKKAGKLELGEEPVANACRAKKARLVLLACDGAENSVRRATQAGEEGAALVVRLPVTKAALGFALGRSSCAVAAVTDVGLAAGLARKLAEVDPEGYTELARRLDVKEARARERQARKKPPGRTK